MNEYPGASPDFIAKLTKDVIGDIETRLAQRIKDLEDSLQSLENSMELKIRDGILRRMFIPNLVTAFPSARGEFMPYSTCSSADFLHPRYAEICNLIRIPPIFNRKMWEWVFIVHKLQKAGMLTEGKRGIAFGVGKERLPALFASLGVSVLATDAPEDIGVAEGWNAGNQHSHSLDQLRFPDIVSDEIFTRKVAQRPCDMNAIDDDLTGFDFTWSSCCFEHLGSIEAGIQFVINSVEKTLKRGGIACHTTEFNLSSEHDTMEDGPTVIYRRKDMLALVERLRERGHFVEPFVVAPDSHYLDHYVDVPPFGSNPHFKLLLGRYVATSVGVVVRKA